MIKNNKKIKNLMRKEVKEFKDEKTKTKDFNQTSSAKWYEEIKCYEEVDPSEVNYEQLQRLRTEANSILSETSILSNSKVPKSLSKSDYAWIKTVMSKGTKTDKIAAYTLIIQDSPVYNLSLLRNMVETVKIGKNKECFMAIDTLRELFLHDLLPPNRKLVSFGNRPLSKLDQLTSGNIANRKKLLLLWIFEDQLKSLYGDFVNYLNKIAHDSVEANKEKVITVMCKLLEGNPEKEEMLLNNIVNKLGDPSHKVGSKVIYALTKLLETHPNMREVVADAVEKVIFRTNINKRAQYYSICFLSQFCLFQGDGKIAKKLIMIYLSLFKACIKTGDIDSRMMSALLTGVNRAYPYAKEEFEILKDHINTIYKVIHLSHANIAIQALSLVHLVSDYSNAHTDRFYSVLYKKVGEAEMFKCTHHAMFLSLIFKALKKDKERVRICAIIKRLLQVSMYIPVPVACGVLIMISEIIKNKKDVFLKESMIEVNPTIKLDMDSDDGEEHYEDVKEEEPSNETGEEIKEEKMAEQVKEEKPTPIQRENIYNIKPVQKMKIWSNPDRSVGSAKEAEISHYDPFVRNPLYAGANKSFYCELLKLSNHFHPTVSLFAKKIIEGEHVIYSGDPLLDFALIRFLDKFSFKNPKVIKLNDEKSVTFSTFGRKKYYSSATVRRLRANTADYLNHSEKNIPVDEVFLYRYMKEKRQKEPRSKKDDNSDVESVGSDEFEEMLSGLAGGKRDEINFLSEVGQLPKKSKKTEKVEDEVEFEGEDDNDVEGSEEGSLDEDFEGDEIENFDEDLMGSDFDEDELEAELEAGGIKLPELTKAKKNSVGRKSKRDFKNGLFASAEEFSELLEDTDNNAGGSEALSNRDKAAAKQLKWESERDKWIHQKNFRSKNIKRPREKMKNQKMRKGGKRKKY